MSVALTLTQSVTGVELFQSPAPGESGYKVLASIPLQDPTRIPAEMADDGPRRSDISG
jgi:hypothetical protein